jgi:CelD/BcsL family acetyltransferase involved in cellulose biosynthesis
MSKARMKIKKKTFAVDEEMAKRLIQLAKVCGLVNVVLINDRLCAGSLSYRIGSNYFAFVNAYDADYEHYWLGILCYYFTIRESILRGGKELHMGFGRYEYKNRLLAVQRDFDRIVIYRSYGKLALNSVSAVKTACQGHVRRLKLWLTDPQRQNSLVSRLAVNSIYRLRQVAKH